MKRVILLSLLTFGFYQFAAAQQSIQTNTKSVCTLQSGEAQGCVDETISSTLTLNENKFQAIQILNGSEVIYAIESKVYESPYWKYTISNTQGDMMYLKVHQTIKEFGFYPINGENGASVTIYKFN